MFEQFKGNPVYLDNSILHKGDSSFFAGRVRPDRLERDTVYMRQLGRDIIAHGNVRTSFMVRREMDRFADGLGLIKMRSSGRIKGLISRAQGAYQVLRDNITVDEAEGEFSDSVFALTQSLLYSHGNDISRADADLVSLAYCRGQNERVGLFTRDRDFQRLYDSALANPRYDRSRMVLVRQSNSRNCKEVSTDPIVVVRRKAPRVSRLHRD